MKCSILQPHYIPWCGYFAMIKNVEKFIFLDDVKFIKREWKNRNRVRKSKNSDQFKWLTVPVTKDSQNNNINRAIIDYKDNWQLEHLNSLTEVYKNAPHFNNCYYEISKIINTKYEFLSDLNIELIRYISKGFNFTTQFIKSSSLHTDGKKDEKLINICLKINSDHYYANKLSGNYINSKNFENSNIKLEYQNYNPIMYDQFDEKKKLKWLGNLSILDLIFNHGFDSLKI